MILHTLIQATTWRKGGKKSPGINLVDLPQTMHHLTGEQLLAQLQALWDAGYALDVNIVAHKDERKPDIQSLYPANPCPECGLHRARERVRQAVAEVLR